MQGERLYKIGPYLRYNLRIKKNRATVVIWDLGFDPIPAPAVRA
jgi:hypothetical protein